MSYSGQDPPVLEIIITQHCHNSINERIEQPHHDGSQHDRPGEEGERTLSDVCEGVDEVSLSVWFLFLLLV